MKLYSKCPLVSEVTEADIPLCCVHVPAPCWYTGQQRLCRFFGEEIAKSAPIEICYTYIYNENTIYIKHLFIFKCVV